MKSEGKARTTSDRRGSTSWREAGTKVRGRRSGSDQLEHGKEAKENKKKKEEKATKNF